MSRAFIRADQLSQADLADAISRGELRPWRTDRDGHRWLRVVQDENTPTAPAPQRSWFGTLLNWFFGKA